MVSSSRTEDSVLVVELNIILLIDDFPCVSPLLFQQPIYWL